MFEDWSRQQKLLLHLGFWLSYFLVFGYVWARDGNYQDAYFLEFILLPIRITAVYTCIYFLIPKYLFEKAFFRFLVSYSLLLLICGMLQQGFIYFFYEGIEEIIWANLFNPGAIFRAALLINSTVMVVACVYILHAYFQEKDKEIPRIKQILSIKSNKRTFRLEVDEILYIQGLGNYISYYLEDGQKVVRYASLKEALTELPDHFVRIHKSYIVNQHHIRSFNQEEVQMIENIILPVGNSYFERLKEKG